jgi:hypothetical protein
MSVNKYVFNLDIQDEPWSNTIIVMSLFVYVLFGMYYASIFMRLNTGNILYCNPSSLTFMWMYAWLFGKNSEKEINKCLMQDNKDAIYDIQNPIKVELDTYKKQIDASMNVLRQNYNVMEQEYSNSESKVNNLAVALQTNVLKIKEALQKVIAAMIIRGHMNDGALKVVKQISKHDKLFTKTMKKINSNDADSAKESVQAAVKSVDKAVTNAVKTSTKAINKAFSAKNMKKTFSIKKKKR